MRLHRGFLTLTLFFHMFAPLLRSDHDDRVSPLHTFKMTAELQHRLKANPNPILCRIDLNSGHGAGKSLGKRIDETCDSECVWCGLHKQFNGC